jgi:hypothetical protein
VSFQRTQVYLDAEDHRRLKQEAARRGLSMTGLLRDIVASHVRERVAPYEPRGFDAIIGVADGPASDVARDERALLSQAYGERLRRKLGVETSGTAAGPRVPRRAPGKRGSR